MARLRAVRRTRSSATYASANWSAWAVVALTDRATVAMGHLRAARDSTGLELGRSYVSGGCAGFPRAELADGGFAGRRWNGGRNERGRNGERVRQWSGWNGERGADVDRGGVRV
ncbi:hypothetical protein O7626_38325 [Micromonospora sp. WMMD1102]|uniref:hypothetical protein n=1 Tax=Micromonospora sp. WMMD1102 TaxID=3016105 RepID=UPI002414DE35|nr:hypothetical protein [Micromonospora sp. WMMD1102]MDG4791684.1 hypothetical protein [Micromonospora sp. WMMD1102]